MFRSIMFLALAAVAALAQQSSPDTRENIAVLTLKNGAGVSAPDAELISDRLRGEFFNTGKVNVMEREQMQDVLKEQGFQQTGACTDEACLVQMGQLLGVKKLATGSIGKLGSMFMINMRMVDVQTGKITRVVSRDIDGGIEDVVGHLRSICDELTGDVGAKTAAAPEQKKAAPQKEEHAAEPEKTSEAPAVALSDRAEKNKNRGGIQLKFVLRGVMKESDKFDMTDEYGTYGYATSTSTLDVSSDDWSYADPLRLTGGQIKFMIRAGKVLTVDLGMGFINGSRKYGKEPVSPVYYSDTGMQIDENIGSYSFMTGLTFVKRWYPIKLNIGIMLDADLMAGIASVTAFDGYGYQVWEKNQYTHVGFTVSPGLRTGIEFLLGKHIGLGADLMLQFSHFTSILPDNYDIYTLNYNYVGTLEITKQITLSPIAFGTGVNFYF
jgi:curli biogenesis system outer membrane secretion channel CsgG